MMSATHGAKKFAEHSTSSYKLICIKTHKSFSSLLGRERIVRCTAASA